MRRRLEYRWIVVIVVVFNSFMQYMDSTIVNVGLPTIGGFFRASPTTMGWAVTGYLLSLAMLIPLSGWMGDHIGTKRTFLLGLATFARGSALCAISWSSETLILFRLLQGAGAGAVLLALFAAHELTTREPMVALRLFSDRLFAAGTIAMFFVQALFVGSIFLLPFLLQSEKGLSPFHSGLVAFPVAIGVGMAVPFAARWYRRVGPRRLLLASMSLSMLSSLGFVLVTAGTSEWGIRLLLLPRGWAFGIALVALGAAAYARVAPEQLGRATALFGIVGQVGSGAGVAFLATALASRMAAHHAAAGNPQTVAGAWEAFHETFAVSALLALLGMGAALLVSDRLVAASMRQDASSTK